MAGVQQVCVSMLASSDSCASVLVRPSDEHLATLKRFLNTLSAEVARCRHYPCGDILRHETRAPRVAAQASDERTPRGDGSPSSITEGRLIRGPSPWYSMEVLRHEWPRYCEKENHLDIGSTCDTRCTAGLFRRGLSPHIESPCSSHMDGHQRQRRRIAQKDDFYIPSISRHHRVAAHTKKMGMRAVVDWSPGAANQEADGRANRICTAINPFSLMYNPTHCNAIFCQMQSNLDARRRRPTRRATWKASCPTSARSRSEGDPKTD